jgi:ubiquitin C-terminal hydrolase
MLAIVDLLKSLHMQTKLWKQYNHTSITWASFCVNDGRIGDVVNVEVMQCIVCYNEVACATILA